MISNRLMTFFLIALLCVSWSCSKEVNQSCEELEIGLLSRNDVILRKEVNEIIEDLNLNRFDESDLDLLARKLNERCDGLSVNKICYGCVKVNPPVSELEVELDSIGILVRRVVDISSPLDSEMSFKGIH